VNAGIKGIISVVCWVGEREENVSRLVLYPDLPGEEHKEFQFPIAITTDVSFGQFDLVTCEQPISHHAPAITGMQLAVIARENERSLGRNFIGEQHRIGLKRGAQLTVKRLARRAYPFGRWQRQSRRLAPIGLKHR